MLRRYYKRKLKVLAVKLAEKLIEERINPKIESTLIDEFIEGQGRKMIANQVGRRYAEAIYEIAVSSDKVKEIYEALNQMMELYKNDNEFKTFITHPLIELDEKKRVLKEMFKNSDETIENIIFYILDKKKNGKHKKYNS